MKRLFIILGSAAVFLSMVTFFVLNLPSYKNQEAPIAGSTLPIAGATYNLAGSGVSSSATSITLQSLTIKQTGQKIQDSDLGDIFYITIEPGSNSKQEIVSCTTVVQNSTTATLSGCVRGLSPITPYTASSTLAVAHGGGSQVIFSDPPQLFNQFYALANMGTSTNVLVFSSTTPPRLDFPGAQAAGSVISTTSEFATVAFVLKSTLSGGANSSETVNGISELATQNEAGSSTSLGSTGARVVLPASMATDTPNTATRGLRVLMSDITGFLKQAWLDLSAPFTWTGLHTFAGGFIGTASSTMSATTTIVASNVLSRALVLNAIPYAFPSAQGAANTFLVNDGSGNLSWTAAGTFVATTTASTTAGYVLGSGASTAEFVIATTTVAANTLGTNNLLQWTIPLTNYSVSANAGFVRVRIYYGSTAIYDTSTNLTPATSAALRIGNIQVRLYGNGATNSQYVQIGYTQASGTAGAITTASINLINDLATTQINEVSTVPKQLYMTVAFTGGTGGSTVTYNTDVGTILLFKR